MEGTGEVITYVLSERRPPVSILIVSISIIVNRPLRLFRNRGKELHSVSRNGAS